MSNFNNSVIAAEATLLSSVPVHMYGEVIAEDFQAWEEWDDEMMCEVQNCSWVA